MHHNPLEPADDLRNLRVQKQKNVVRPLNEYNIAYDINSLIHALDVELWLRTNGLAVWRVPQLLEFFCRALKLS